MLLLSGPQILADHHRTARGQRREQHDDEVVDHIHQADAGDGRFAAAGDHHRIRHAHRHFQQLLYQQRAGQKQQLFLGEQRLPPAEPDFFFGDRSFHRVPHVSFSGPGAKRPGSPPAVFAGRSTAF